MNYFISNFLSKFHIPIIIYSRIIHERIKHKIGYVLYFGHQCSYHQHSDLQHSVVSVFIFDYFISFNKNFGYNIDETKDMRKTEIFIQYFLICKQINFRNKSI